jgi:hypothetical protein
MSQPLNVIGEAPDAIVMDFCVDGKTGDNHAVVP